MMKLLSAAAAALALHASALAQMGPPNPDPGVAPQGGYVLDNAHARVTWTVSHMGLAGYSGWFMTKDATLDFNPQAPERSALSVTVDPASVFTGDPDFDAKIAGERGFNTAVHPKITFVSTGIERTGPATGKVTGDLTFFGVTRPLTLDVTFNGGMMSLFKAGTYLLGFSATGTFKRSDFGFTAWAPAAGDDVTLTIEAEFMSKGE